MRKLLILLFISLLLPTSVKAKWFADKTFYLSCNKTHHKLSPDGKSNWSNWVPLPEKITNKKHYDKYTLNEEDKSAYLYLSTSEDHERLDVLIFNKAIIKLVSNTEGKSWNMKVTRTINRNDGEYIQKLESKTIYQNSPTYSYMKGICKKVKSQKALF
jgi:hypothetical protein